MTFEKGLPAPADLPHGKRHEPMSVEDAVAVLGTLVSPIRETERIPLASAQGRVLAEDVKLPFDQPRFDNSAVDGYAVRTTDLQRALRSFTIVGTASAGLRFSGAVHEGEVVRILTGAALPDGADRVVMQEECLASDDRIAVLPALLGKDNVRRRGEEMRAGEVALSAGTRLTPAELALAAAAGAGSLRVYRRVAVGLASTGNELREPGATMMPGQIWDSNTAMLSGCLARLGCDVVDLGILPDRPATLEPALVEAARNLDLIVTSGGVSVGSEDHMRQIIGRRGSLELWQIAIKPGRPVGVGDIDDCPILALPGNPFAAFIAFVTLGKQLVNRLTRASDIAQAAILLPARFQLEKKPGLRTYLPARLVDSAVDRLERHGPAIISALARMSGLIELPEACTNVVPGDLVAYRPRETLLA